MTDQAPVSADPLIDTLAVALGWDWKEAPGVPSPEACLTDVAAALRERFTLEPKSHG